MDIILWQSTDWSDLFSIPQPYPESVPYKVALHNRTTLLSSTESRESLSLQVTSFHERVSRLEQEKEHWMLEAQLLQMKFEKEKMVIKKIYIYLYNRSWYWSMH